jgi:hypothetical protein
MQQACRLQESKVETELQAAKKERDLAAEKAKEARSLLLKEEKKMRLQLEDKITQRAGCAEGVGISLRGLMRPLCPMAWWHMSWRKPTDICVRQVRKRRELPRS